MSLNPQPHLLGLPLVARHLTLGERTLPIWLPVYDDHTLERIVAQYGLSEKHWPYYLENWPATFALAEHLGEKLALKGSGVSATDPWHPRVLDLGCGGGALACYLWKQFGIEPFCLDCNPEACALTRYNLKHHGAEGAKVLCADLVHSPLGGTFDLILGGEMLYAPGLLPGLLAFLSAHLATGGEALFADARRGSAENFAPMAASAGFKARRESTGNTHVYVLSQARGRDRL